MICFAMNWDAHRVWWAVYPTYGVKWAVYPTFGLLGDV